jgi:hypothetical protein
MKAACKAAQFQSNKVFLKAYLRHHPPIVADAIVVGVGPGSLQLYMPTLAFNQRLPVSKLGYHGKMDNAFVPVGVADTSGGDADGCNAPIAQLQLYTAQGYRSGSGDDQENTATPASTPPLFTLSFLSVVKVKVSCDTRPKPSEIHIELIQLVSSY